MKIKRMRWRNYKGLVDGEINADGHDVLITGRNGAGKSSIAEILPFVLFGKVTGSLKHYDEQGLTVRDRLIHGAEIEFDNGMTFRRTLTDSSSGGLTAQLFINGEQVQKRQFDSKVETLTNGAGELILNPFAIFDMTNKERRNFVARTFGALSEREILSTPEHAEIAAMLDGSTAEVFIATCKNDLRRLKAQVTEIPIRLAELERQLENVPQDTDDALKKIDDYLAQKRAEQAKLMTPITQPQDFTQRIRELEGQESYLTRQLERERNRREQLLSEYKRVKASKLGNCPTCGQPIPADVFHAKRDEKLFDIVTEGKAVAAQIAEFEAELKSARAQLKSVREQKEQSAAQSETSAKAEASRVERLNKINEEIAALESEKSRLKIAKTLHERIKRLQAQERQTNVEIAAVEGKLTRAEKFQHEKIRLFEKVINDNFEHVKFKLYDRLADGTPKEVCEAMLDGVPFQSLSKGEKLKAALDIWRAVQRHYGAELPLIVDDAESYTNNSFIDVSNQKFLLCVTESDLSIEIDRRRLAA